jgi:methylaspartate ammonia-lyase
MSKHAEYEPVIVVYRHPDYATETTEHYLDVRVVDIDLGASFDITNLAPGECDDVREYVTHLREQVADLPLDHEGRMEVEAIADQIMEQVSRVNA